MDKILISIIIPVYKVEKYILRCLESIIGQDYQGNIECILIDDCGNDASMTLATKFINNKQKNKSNIIFRICKHKSNQGLSEARNTGTKAALGEYIYYLDSDDELMPNCISSLVKCAQKYPTAEIIQSGCLCIQDGEKWNLQPWLDFENTQHPEYVDNQEWIKAYMLNPTYPVTAWNKLIKKDFILQNKLFFKTGIIHEDDHWSFFLAKYVKHLAFLNQNTLIHYIHSDSIMRTRSQNNKSYNSWCIIWKDMVTHIDDFCKEAQIKRVLSSTISYLLFSKSSKTRKEIKCIIKILRHKMPHELKIPFLLYYYLPYIIRRRPFMYRYFINKFTNHVINL